MSQQIVSHLDDRDVEIVASRLEALRGRVGPQVGDYVRFSDGTLRRISHHWRDDEGWDGGVQTSDGGSFYLSDHGCSFSGSLRPSIPTDRLQATDEMVAGRAWIFHHDMHQAHNGVDFEVPFRVFEFDGEPN